RPLRLDAARLNPALTPDATFPRDLSERAGNRVASLRLQSDGRLLIGGAFSSLQPIGATGRVARRNFARLLATGQVDTAFDAAAGGATGATVTARAVQPDGRVVAVGRFAYLGGTTRTQSARCRPEGTPDPDFSPVLTTDGPVNAVVVRTAGAPVPTQLSGFAWLNSNGTLRSAFAAAGARLSGEIGAVAIDREGRLLVGGSFANLNNSSGGNLALFKADGSLDASFTPGPNGAVTGIVVQPDGRIVVVGSFTTVAGTARNRMARIDDNGSLDVTFDPNANGRITSVIRQSDGKLVVGGDFTGFTPNLTTTNVPRNYLARVNEDGTVDANYNPSPSAGVTGLAPQADGKVVVVGNFNSVTPNGTTTPVTRNYVARLNTDGTLDQNFNPNAGATVNAVVALSNGQFLLGGSFTTLQPSAGGALVFRNNLARINSDGAVDQTFNPNPNGAVTTLAVQSDGFVLLGGSFTTLQPGGTGVPVTRNRLARVDTGGAIDLNFNPDIRGTISVVAARPDGSVLVGGNFTDLQLNGSI
ncbi:MAG: delta-60 repeat domain-containing protein, partial [Opitutaceae bacterium]